MGVIFDPHGAVIAGAQVSVRNQETSATVRTITDGSGAYSISYLPTGYYSVEVAAAGFGVTHSSHVRVGVGESLVLNETLAVAVSRSEIRVSDAASIVQNAASRLSTNLDSHLVDAIPLASRNFTQLIDLVPGTVSSLNDNTALGRGSKAFAVNGVRANENSYQLNGVDANDIVNNGPSSIPVPAPESVREISIQTSLYDASYGRSPGAQVQVITQSGTKAYHGSIYEYFRNDFLNSNVPDLKAAGVPRPPLRRNVYGATLGGPLRRDRTFVFLSYQGTRENNVIEDALFDNVLIAPGLSYDRSTSTLTSTFGVASIHPSSLALLNARLGNGDFVIPTPQVNGRVSGSAPSRFHEEQFNANFDFRPGARDWLSAKFFFADANAIRGLGAVNLPGVPTADDTANRVLALEYVRNFRPQFLNEFRFGVSYLRSSNSPLEQLNDSDFGITRSTAATYLGLPNIGLGPEARIGSPLVDSSGNRPTITMADTISLHKGSHDLRAGTEIRYYRENFTANAFSRGEIDFSSWNNFLTGSVDFAFLGSGIPQREYRATDYDLFAQDDWEISRSLTLNVGLRYELNLPPYETHGRIGNFDPALYSPPTQAVNGFPVGPPGGIVIPGNSVYQVSGVTRTGKRMLRSTDPNNFGPRLGFAWSPFASSRIAIRGGYGVYFSREAFDATNLTFLNAPFFFIGEAFGTALDNPFPVTPATTQLPALFPGISGFSALDPDLRTPYVQQFNLTTEFAIVKETTLRVGYVGSSGVRLYRAFGYNEARLASAEHPIINVTTPEVITTNTPENAILRAPFQGLSTFPFNNAQFRSDSHSTYNSLQISLKRRYRQGAQLELSYTYSKSLDDSTSRGAGPSGLQDVGNGNQVVGEQLNSHMNRSYSDFDRTHRLVAAGSWELPLGALSRAAFLDPLLSGWSISGLLAAQSGIPVDVIDTLGGSLYGTAGGHASWAPGAERHTAMQHQPPGYYFNPFSFMQAIVPPGGLIPSSGGTATAVDGGSDIGSVRRNSLRGPSQSNLDLAASKSWRFSEQRRFECRLEFFNVLNHPNRSDPISDISVVGGSGGSFDPFGRIIEPGDFGKSIGHSGSPRIGQIALRFTF